MEATGLTDILMEARLVGSGTIGRIMSRKKQQGDGLSQNGAGGTTVSPRRSIP